MRKVLILFLLLFSCLYGHAQITYYKGYFITNLNQRIECLIKNVGWQKNPTRFKYKNSEQSQPKEASIGNVKEFGIYGNRKYIRSTVQIDHSPYGIKNLSTTKAPEFQEESLYLQVLVEGEASLYLYEGRNLKKFLYKNDDGQIEQLIFKRYMPLGKKDIRLNTTYKSQIWKNMKCPCFTFKEVNSLNYEEDELIKLFVKYNTEKGHPYNVFEGKSGRNSFHISLRPGINSSTFSIQGINPHFFETKFDQNFSYRVGVELEYVLPYNEEKWAFVLEPSYQNLNTQFENEKQRIVVNYKTVNLNIGLRHYFYLNNKSKFFAEGGFLYALPNNSLVDYELSQDLELNTSTNFVFGAGYNYKNKLSLAFQYQTARDPLSNYRSISSKFTASSIILGYSLF